MKRTLKTSATVLLFTCCIVILAWRKPQTQPDHSDLDAFLVSYGMIADGYYGLPVSWEEIHSAPALAYMGQVKLDDGSRGQQYRIILDERPYLFTFEDLPALTPAQADTAILTFEANMRTHGGIGPEAFTVLSNRMRDVCTGDGFWLCKIEFDDALLQEAERDAARRGDHRLYDRKPDPNKQAAHKEQARQFLQTTTSQF